MKIIFLGTPEFSVASLEALIHNGFKVVAVVTAPDKPAGRGMELQQSAVKKYAVANHIPVLQPEKLRSPEFIEQLRSYEADLQVVIAFRMLPEVVWSMPRYGTMNLHASLLPDYRGAAPINWAIINGEKKTGVCTFLLKHEIDTGDIIMKKSVAIAPDMNAGQLHDQLMELGAQVIVASVKQIENGTARPIPQKNESHKTAPKIFTEHCRINWNNPGKQIYNLIRGLSPYPCAFIDFENKKLKIYEARFVQSDSLKKPGTIDMSFKSSLRIYCVDGYISLEDVQLQGKKRMLIKDFLNGYRKHNNY